MIVLDFAYTFISMDHIEKLSMDVITNSGKPRIRFHCLILILIIAGFLRFYNLEQSPPGLNQDEAANAWNAYCLLKTGKDQAGESWPIFYTRSLGGNSSTLFIYFMIPFQALGGLNIISTRIPGAFAGIITVLLVYYTGKKLFDDKVGLFAAFLLSLNPWNLQLSRWGHESTLCALLGLVPLAAMLMSRLPLTDKKEISYHPFAALIAGIVTGIGTYGYHSVRIFVPILLFTLVILTLPEFWNYIKKVKGLINASAFFIGFLIIFGPLAWQHIFYPEGISRHGLEQYKAGYLLLHPPYGAAIKNILLRYINHFGLEFLFIHGDPYIIQSPPESGQFHWYVLPLMIIGMVFIIRYFKISASFRTLFAFVIVYPVGDIIYSTAGLHSLRSAPGMCALTLLASVGGVFGFRWLFKQSRQIAIAVIIIFSASVVFLNIRFFKNFYIDFNKNTDIYHVYQTDLVEACKWLKPRIDDFDAVFFTTESLNMPYAVSLVVFGYEPEKWFEDKRNYYTEGEWDYYTQYGKMYFMYNNFFTNDLNTLITNKTDGNYIFVIRPSELNLTNPLYRVIGPYGSDAMWICRLPVP